MSVGMQLDFYSGSVNTSRMLNERHTFSHMKSIALLSESKEVYTPVVLWGCDAYGDYLKRTNSGCAEIGSFS